MPPWWRGATMVIERVPRARTMTNNHIMILLTADNKRSGAFEDTDWLQPAGCAVNHSPAYCSGCAHRHDPQSAMELR